MRIIAGTWKSRRLETLSGRGVRPTTDRVREAWMSILSPRLPGARALDLFAGSGALGLEALSRGAAHVTFVERSRRSLGVLERNVATLGAESRSTVIAGEALAHIRGTGAAYYDLALADPPYERGFAARVASLYLRTPFARELWIEHDIRETLPGDVIGEQRRYGDTVLTRVIARGGDA